MQRKDGQTKKHGGGRKRTVFCDSCKITPIPVKSCRPCQNIYETDRRNDNREQTRRLSRERYARNIDHDLARKKKSRYRTEEVYKNFLKTERLRKSQVRYGEFAEAHIEFKKTVRLLKEVQNENE